MSEPTRQAPFDWAWKAAGEFLNEVTDGDMTAQNTLAAIITRHAEPNERLRKAAGLWFSYDPCDCFQFHNTEAEAKASAEKSLDAYRDEAGDGWNEEVNGVCWGTVSQKVEEISRKEKPPESELEDGRDKDGTDFTHFDSIVEYALQPALSTPPQKEGMPVVERYVIEADGKMHVEHPPFNTKPLSESEVSK